MRRDWEVREGVGKEGIGGDVVSSSSLGCFMGGLEVPLCAVVWRVVRGIASWDFLIQFIGTGFELCETGGFDDMVGVTVERNGVRVLAMTA
jgi:hypothetical protein